jgi:nicotinamidase-related amidase
MLQQVKGLYPWPYDGPWSRASAALIVVDMQRDFLELGGWFSLTNGDAGPLSAIVPRVAEALGLARQAGLLVVYTIEAHKPDLSDLPANKLWRSKRLGAAIGAVGPLGRHLVQEEAGSDIIPALAPIPGEPVVAKPGKSAFIGCDFEQLLRKRGIRNLIFAGITTDGAVQCTLRDANDRGYECLILEDAAASDLPAHHSAQIHTLALAGGHYGSIAATKDLAAVISPEVDYATTNS